MRRFESNDCDATAVDWAGSAVSEFMYLNLVLGRNLTPKAAGDSDSDWISRAPSWSANGRYIAYGAPGIS